MPRPQPVVLPGQGSMGSSFRKTDTNLQLDKVAQFLGMLQEIGMRNQKQNPETGYDLLKAAGLYNQPVPKMEEQPVQTSPEGGLVNFPAPINTQPSRYNALAQTGEGQKTILDVLKKQLEPAKYEHAAPGSVGYNPLNPKEQVTLGEAPEPKPSTAHLTSPDDTSPTGYRHFVFNEQTGAYDKPDRPAIPPAGTVSKPIGIEDVTSMRKEFEGSQIYKDYVSVKPQQEKIKQAYNMIGENNVAVDQTIITVLNKMLDPTSVVRESEYARTPQNLALLNRAAGNIEKFGVGGAGLTDDDRKAILDMANKFGDITSSYYKEHEGAFKRIADHYGIPKHLVITTPSFGFKENKESTINGAHGSY